MSDHCGWDEIHAWVDAHRESLPQTLDELAKYPMAYRRAIQAAVSPEARATFWCDHLRSFLAPGTQLPRAQQAFIEEVIAKMPDICAASSSEAQKAARTLEVRMIPLFTREQAYSIFATLGPAEPTEGLESPS